MRDKLKKIIFSFLLLEIFLSYGPAYAADTYNYASSSVATQIAKYLCAPSEVTSSQTNYTNAATKIGTDYQTYAATNNTNSSDLYNCINKLYKFAIIFASVLGVFFLVIAGFVYMSAGGNQEGVDKAKSYLETTLTSLVILMAGYLLLQAINPDLTFFKNTQPPSVTLSIDTSSTSGTTSTTGLTESDARAQLTKYNISINADPPKTTLVGIKQSTLDIIISLKQACSNCEIIVTGGTESGHSESGTCTHSQGYKFDLSMNTNLNNYITTGFSYIGVRSDGAKQWQSPYTKAIYAQETTQGTGAHWDVTNKAACQ